MRFAHAGAYMGRALLGGPRRDGAFGNGSRSPGQGHRRKPARELARLAGSSSAYIGGGTTVGVVAAILAGAGEGDAGDRSA